MSKKIKIVESVKNMSDEAILSSNGQFTSFSFNGHNIRFRTSPRLERYTKIIDWDNGYIVVMANLNRPEKAAYLSRSGEVLETSMDDVELDIVQEYYQRNRKYMEE